MPCLPAWCGGDFLWGLGFLGARLWGQWGLCSWEDHGVMMEEQQK